MQGRHASTWAAVVLEMVEVERNACPGPCYPSRARLLPQILAYIRLHRLSPCTAGSGLLEAVLGRSVHRAASQIDVARNTKMLSLDGRKFDRNRWSSLCT